MRYPYKIILCPVDFDDNSMAALAHARRLAIDMGATIHLLHVLPILPMLASTATSVAEAVSGFELASVEWKLDGIRIQVHRREQAVRVYTRNLNEITATLPGIVDEVLGLPVRQAVFDGEALWMNDDGPAAFQDTVSRIDGDAPPEGIVTFIFDVLHIDGENLLGVVGIREVMRSLVEHLWRQHDPEIRETARGLLERERSGAP